MTFRDLGCYVEIIIIQALYPGRKLPMIGIKLGLYMISVKASLVKAHIHLIRDAPVMSLELHINQSVFSCTVLPECTHTHTHSHTHTPMHVHAHEMYNFIHTHTHPPTLHRFITLQFCGSTGWTAPQRPTTAVSAGREVDHLPAAGCQSPHDYHTHHWQIQKNKVYITLLHI